jgi:hypothetical protein
MTAPIVASQKYTARGTSKVYWVPAIANRDAPTRAELTAGTDLSRSVTDSAGWSVSTEQIEAPSLADRYTPTVPGTITSEDSSLTMFASKNGIDARSLMPRDASGHIVWMDGGDVAGNKMDVYPVTVSSVSKQRQVQGGEVDTLMIAYAITDVPSENVTVP